MKNIFTVILLFIGVIVLVLSDFGRQGYVVYDCRDAHWHSDVPVDVKKECARLLKDEWDRKQKEEQTKKSLITI